MKKASLIMIAVTCLFFAFCAGIFLGRSMNRSPILVSALPPQSSIADTEISETHTPDKININTATAAELMTLDGIGEVLAQRIIAHRQAHGHFRSLAELSEVEGIGSQTLENILDRITIGGQ